MRTLERAPSPVTRRCGVTQDFVYDLRRGFLRCLLAIALATVLGACSCPRGEVLFDEMCIDEVPVTGPSCESFGLITDPIFGCVPPFEPPDIDLPCPIGQLVGPDGRCFSPSGGGGGPRPTPPPPDESDLPENERLADACVDGDTTACLELCADTSVLRLARPACGIACDRGEALACDELCLEGDIRACRRQCGGGDLEACGRACRLDLRACRDEAELRFLGCTVALGLDRICPDTERSDNARCESIEQSCLTMERLLLR